MAMSFENVLKGQMTQTMIKTLFERAGYRVTRLGVEEVFDEVTHLDEASYHALKLPLALRYLPDFLIADSDLTTAFLLEVKYRRAWNEATIDSLRQELTQQRVYWPEAYAVIIIADYPYPASRFHQHYIRVVPPDRTDLLRALGPEDHLRLNPQMRPCEPIWEDLPWLTCFARFRAIGDTAINGKHADMLTGVIKTLRHLP